MAQPASQRLRPGLEHAINLIDSKLSIMYMLMKDVDQHSGVDARDRRRATGNTLAGIKALEQLKSRLIRSLGPAE